ncbi:MAG: DEAD/DEAH box helicase [Phaeodactylibacter sp.]|uniref:DEAD/DEAH box helicase n=1 Tax=Phaeodactylibacter sp. TaxID=1940289 RepID=UPI0032EEDAE0
MSTFESLGLSQPITEAVTAIGFETPTAIQEQAIPHLLAGEQDFVGLAQTGTGKTAAFGLPLLDRTDVSLPFVQSLVLAPTRELCLQISRELESFAKNQPKLKILSVYGGADIRRQIKALEKGVQVLVATPGRLRDLMRRGKVDYTHLQQVVLDEADEMLNMGFKEEIDEILEAVPEQRRTWLFSATMPPDVRRISEDYMDNPFELSVGTQNSGNVDISHQFVVLRPAERYEALRRFLDMEPNLFALVFCRTRRETAEVAESLSRDGYKADAIHGDLNQTQRDRVMQGFRDRRLRVLVATDVAARGIDVDNITHVFHFNIPDDLNFYTHRSGRTGRAGNKGISLVLAHPKDRHLLRRLEKTSKISFESVEIPSGPDIFERRLLRFFDKINAVEPNPALLEYLPQIMTTFEGLSREDLLLKMATATMPEKMQAYAKSKPIGQKASADKGFLKPSESRRVFVNIGMIDINGKGELLSYLCEKGGITGAAVGKIDLQRKHAFVQVELQAATQLINRLDGNTYNGRTLRVNDGGPQPTASNKKRRQYPKYGKSKKKYSKKS